MNFDDVGQMVDELVQKSDFIEQPATDAEAIERKCHVLTAAAVSEILAWCQKAERRLYELETRQLPERYLSGGDSLNGIVGGKG